MLLLGASQAALMRYLSDTAATARVVGAFYCNFITLEFKNVTIYLELPILQPFR